jgi:hypothetical protein
LGQGLALEKAIVDGGVFGVLQLAQTLRKPGRPLRHKIPLGSHRNHVINRADNPASVSGWFRGKAMLRVLMTAGVLSLGASAQAQEASSLYTRVEDCANYQYADEPVWETACRGIGDWSFFLASSEHGEGIAYAHDSSERTDFMTAPQRGMFGNFHDVVEWRGHGEAIETSIHRYYSYAPTGENDADGKPEMDQFETLVVTALRPGEAVVACQVAFVDASAISGANEAAQLVADSLAGEFECGVTPVYEFNTGVDEINAAIAALGD